MTGAAGEPGQEFLDALPDEARERWYRRVRDETGQHLRELPDDERDQWLRLVHDATMRAIRGAATAHPMHTRAGLAELAGVHVAAVDWAVAHGRVRSVNPGSQYRSYIVRDSWMQDVLASGVGGWSGQGRTEEEMRAYARQVEALRCDPVGVAEIADRLGCSVSAVMQWRRRHQDFPEPIWLVSDHKAWEWRDVVEWCRRTGRMPAAPRG